ncbi:MAG TPA: hypothetical protein DHH42_02550 [Clostridiales bacterium]|nr:hypothetical protein [Clostridiales bacterium]
MKRSKLLLVLVLALVAVMALVACDKTPVHEHAYGGWTIETAPTASAEGTATRKCACGEKETATLASLSDTSVWTVSNNVPATHTQDGCTVYTSQYGTVVVTLGKLTDHKYGAWEITVEPDLTTAGKAKRTCECGDIDEVDVPALENASVWTAATVVRASHDEEGLVRYTSVYGTVEKTVAKGEHSWSSWKIVTAPTAIEKGEAARFCTTDGCKSTETAELPVLTDTTVWTASVAAATCTTPEITTYTSVYGTVTVETAAANGHNFQVSAIVTEPTCTEKGSATIKCTVCDCEETKEIAALGHDFEHGTWVINTIITGEEDTKHIRKCSRCDEVSTSLMYRKDHNFGEPVYKVSEYMSEYHTVTAYYTCTDCGYSKSESIDEFLENESAWAKGEETLADYNNEGRVTYTYKEDNTQITIVTPKLVAPYDGKTYTAADVDFKTEPDALSKCDKINAFITLDETGKGTGTAFPFKGDVSVTMVDSATGKIRFASDGNTYDGYVDMETGIIVYFGLFNKVYILSPFDSANSEYKASQFALSRAIEYTPDCNLGSKHSFTMFVTDDKVYFGVRFNNGTADISANECFEAENLVVFDKDGNKIKGFKKVDGTTTALDGYEGTYTNSEDTTESVVIDGIGGLVINGTVNGVYTKAADADYFEVYVVDGSGVKTAYYHVTISGDKYTKVAKNATVKFTSAEGTAPADATVFANIDYVLAPMADTETKKFMGWKRAGSEEIITSVKPAIDEEINLEAVWADKVKINIVDSVGGNKTAYIGDGESIAETLGYAAKQISPDKTKYFSHWFIDENVDGVYTEGETVISEEVADAALNDKTLVAVWNDRCLVSGTYYGTYINTHGKSSSSNKSKGSVVISVDGDITFVKYGEKTDTYIGTVVAYDAASQKVTWKQKRADGTYFDKEYSFKCDTENEIIAGLSNDTTIGEYYYFLTTANTDKSYKVVAQFGIPYPGTTTYSVQFLKANTINGEINVFIFNEHIYTNVTFKNIDGQELAVSQIVSAKTVFVYDESGEVIVGFIADKESFDKYSSAKFMDLYSGTYTCEGQSNLVIDGIGGFTRGTETGTYTLVDKATAKFDAYVVVDGKNVTYYEVVLDVENKTYTIDKTMISLTFENTDGVATDPAFETEKSFNKNIAITLPVYTNASKKLKGWKIDGTDQIVTEYTPVENGVKFVAVWVDLAVLTINYNDGSAAVEQRYGKGDTATVESPERNGKIFLGWYTTATFEESSKWTSGTAINENTTIYAKWQDCPYANTYTFAYFTSNTSKMESTYENLTKKGATEAITFNGLTGVGTLANGKKGILPFYDCTSRNEGTGWGSSALGYTIKVTAYDEATGALTFYVVKAADPNDDWSYESKYTINAYIDKETGVIVASYFHKTYSSAAQFSALAIMVPTGYSIEASKVSVWNKTNSVVDYLDAAGNAHSIVVIDGKVYFDASVTDSDGNRVACNAVYNNAKTMLIKESTAADAKLVVKLVYNGTTLVALDGYDGVYSNETVGNVELDGISTVTFGGNTGVYSKTADENILDVYMTEGENTVYYELVVNKTGNTCTVTKVMVNVTFESSDVTADSGTPKAVNVNKNIAFTLPTLTNASMIFRGWYVSTDETKAIVPMNYVPTADVTLVAKWDEKVTATIVYGNGMENATAEFGKGDALNLSAYVPVKTSGKWFSKWYVLDGAAHADLPATIDANMTVYCEWTDTPPYTFTTSAPYKFTYADGVWTSSNKGVNNSESWFKITTNADITVTFQYFCESENAEKWDWLSIKKNGTQIYKDGGNKSGKIVYSEVVTVELKAGETLEFIYKKDGSGNTGLDSAYIKDLAINGTAVTEM